MVSSVRGWMSRKPKILVAAIVLMALGLFSATGSAMWFAYDLTAALPSKAQVKDMGEMAQSTTILDTHDKPVFTIFKEQRHEVPIDRISPNIIKAVVSVEDQRFFEHQGVDPIRIGAAVVRNFQEGRRAEGGSPSAAARAPEFLAGQDVPPQDQGSILARTSSARTRRTTPRALPDKATSATFVRRRSASPDTSQARDEVNVERGRLLAGLIQSRRATRRP